MCKIMHKTSTAYQYSFINQHFKVKAWFIQSHFQLLCVEGEEIGGEDRKLVLNNGESNIRLLGSIQNVKWPMCSGMFLKMECMQRMNIFKFIPQDFKKGLLWGSLYSRIFTVTWRVYKSSENPRTSETGTSLDDFFLSVQSSVISCVSLSDCPADNA